MTKEQDVVKAKGRLDQLKQDYMTAVGSYVAAVPNTSAAAKAAALESQRRATAYFNYVEEFVGNSDLLGAHRSAMWAQGFAEDCAEILGSMPGHIKFLRTAFSNFPDLKDVDLAPGPTAFANMQRMTVLYLSDGVVKNLRAAFEAEGLPVYGFKHEAKQFMNRTLRIALAFGFGVVFISVMLAIALLKPDPSDFQYKVFWAVVAMSLAGIAAVMPGFIEVRVSKWVYAGGALAVFVMVYFWTPGGRPDAKAPPTPAVASPSAGASSAK